MRHRPVKNLIDKRFGRLTVIEFDGFSDRSVPKWCCNCDCGGSKVASAYSLLSGDTISCGCFSVERIRLLNKTHGLSETIGYNTWCGMKQRTSNPNSEYWSDYGGRGIKVCDEWDNSFEAYWRDMGPTFQVGLTLDRIDVNGNYYKENCRWATMSVQDHNKRKRKGCASQYLGVSFISATSKWQAAIQLEGKRRYLGCFHSEYEAATIYDNHSEELYGDRPNKTSRNNPTTN